MFAHRECDAGGAAVHGNATKQGEQQWTGAAKGSSAVLNVTTFPNGSHERLYCACNHFMQRGT